MAATVCVLILNAFAEADAPDNVPASAFAGSFEKGAGPGPASVAVADVDLDGLADIVVANSESDDVSVLYGTSWSSELPEYEPAVHIPVTSSDVTAPAAVQVADMNRDGLPDIVVALEGADKVGVIVQVSERVFEPRELAETGSVPSGLAVADFDGDGVPDVVTSNSFEDPGTVSVLLGQGDGTFFSQMAFEVVPAGSSLDTGAAAVVAADINSDSAVDLLVANDQGNNVAILLGYGDSTFAEARNIDLGASGQAPVALAVGDINMDGRPDIVTANEDGFTVSVLLAGSDGAFADAPGSPVEVGSLPAAVTVWDFNLDGRPDIAVTNSPGGDAVSILRGNGDGTFQPVEDFEIAGEGPIAIAGSDLNGDHKRDLVTANFDADTPEENALSILVNDGELLLGDSDNSGLVTAADIMGVDEGSRPVGVVHELFDGDGSSVITVAGGTTLSGPGVDGNGDEIVNAADAVAIAAIVAGATS